RCAARPRRRARHVVARDPRARAHRPRLEHRGEDMSTTEVMGILSTMIADVLGNDLIEIVPTTSFKEGLEVKSIEFIALAELIQERYTDIDFVAWLSAKEMPQILALRVGDVADFIVASS